jgi:hypothetical protein
MDADQTRDILISKILSNISGFLVNRKLYLLNCQFKIMSWDEFLYLTEEIGRRIIEKSWFQWFSHGSIWFSDGSTVFSCGSILFQQGE